MSATDDESSDEQERGGIADYSTQSGQPVINTSKSRSRPAARTDADPDEQEHKAG